MDNFGWAFIGCGSIANKVAGELLKIGAGKIVAVWNRTKSRAEEFSEKFGGRVYDTAEECIEGEGVQAVYIATTHDKHLYFTMLALNAGVPVLCEKPATVNVSELDRAISLAKEKNVYYAEAMWTWHNPVSLEVKKWLKEGLAGEVKSVRASFAFPMAQFRRNPRLTSPNLIGGALLDIGIYPVRYVYELFGMPQKIECSGKLEGGVDDEESIKLIYGGFEANIFVSMTRLKGEKLVIEGTDGKIVVPLYHKAQKAKITGKNGRTFKQNRLLYGLEFLHTAEDVSAGKKESGYCPLTSTRDVMLILDEIRRRLNLTYPCEEGE